MKKLLPLAILVVFLNVGAAAQAANQDQASKVRNPLLGAWRLLWLEEPSADGKVHKADCTGLLVYTRDGHMSVQVMYRNWKAGAQAGPVQYAQGGYEASFGTYKVDENSHTFLFHVEGAMVHDLIGKDLPRAYQLSGNQLIVQSTNADEHWRVAWEHY